MVTQISDWVENIVGKGEIVVMSNFSFSQNVWKAVVDVYQIEYLWSKGL